MKNFTVFLICLLCFATVSFCSEGKKEVKQDIIAASHSTENMYAVAASFFQNTYHIDDYDFQGIITYFLARSETNEFCGSSIYSNVKDIDPNEDQILVFFRQIVNVSSVEDMNNEATKRSYYTCVFGSGERFLGAWAFYQKNKKNFSEIFNAQFEKIKMSHS